jgi:hypothetical protein
MLLDVSILLPRGKAKTFVVVLLFDINHVGLCIPDFHNENCAFNASTIVEVHDGTTR